VTNLGRKLEPPPGAAMPSLAVGGRSLASARRETRGSALVPVEEFARFEPRDLAGRWGIGDGGAAGKTRPITKLTWNPLEDWERYMALLRRVRD
jgi:hypothetical protein